jgi:hypothetical protein
VENIKTTLSRLRESQITRKEYGLIPLYRILEASNKNLKGIYMDPNEVETIRHVNNMEKMDMQRMFSIRRDMI